MVEVVEQRRDEEIPPLSRSQLPDVVLARVVTEVDHVHDVPVVVVRVVEVPSAVEQDSVVVDEVSLV